MSYIFLYLQSFAIINETATVTCEINKLHVVSKSTFTLSTVPEDNWSTEIQSTNQRYFGIVYILGRRLKM